MTFYGHSALRSAANAALEWQGAWCGEGECLWRPVHSVGWLDSHLRVVNSRDMQFQTQRRNHLQYRCQLRIARRR